MSKLNRIVPMSHFMSILVNERVTSFLTALIVGITQKDPPGGEFGQSYFSFNSKHIIMTDTTVPKLLHVEGLARVFLQSLKKKLASCSFISLY